MEAERRDLAALEADLQTFEAIFVTLQLQEIQLMMMMMMMIRLVAVRSTQQNRKCNGEGSIKFVCALVSESAMPLRLSLIYLVTVI